MDTGKAIFLGLALIALAIFATDAVRPADARIMGGKYMGVSGGTPIVWVVDTETGAVKKCDFEDCEVWTK